MFVQGCNGYKIIKISRRLFIVFLSFTGGQCCYSVVKNIPPQHGSSLITMPWNWNLAQLGRALDLGSRGHQFKSGNSNLRIYTQFLFISLLLYRWWCFRSESIAICVSWELAQFGQSDSLINYVCQEFKSLIPNCWRVKRIITGGSYPPNNRFDSCASATTLLLRRNSNRKKVYFSLIKITKQEMLYLQGKGIQFGENGITHTSSRHRRTYYLTESRKCMMLLNEYRNKRIKK